MVQTVERAVLPADCALPKFTVNLCISLRHVEQLQFQQARAKLIPVYLESKMKMENNGMYCSKEESSADLVENYLE